MLIEMSFSVLCTYQWLLVKHNIFEFLWIWIQILLTFVITSSQGPSLRHTFFFWVIKAKSLLWALKKKKKEYLSQHNCTQNCSLMAVKNQLLDISFCLVFSSDKYTLSGSIDFLLFQRRNKYWFLETFTNL